MNFVWFNNDIYYNEDRFNVFDVTRFCRYLKFVVNLLLSRGHSLKYTGSMEENGKNKYKEREKRSFVNDIKRNNSIVIKIKNTHKNVDKNNSNKY